MTTTEMSSAREADECIALETLSSAPPNSHPSPHFPRKVLLLPLGLGLLLLFLLLHDLELAVAKIIGGRATNHLFVLVQQLHDC